MFGYISLVVSYVSMSLGCCAVCGIDVWWLCYYYLALRSVEIEDCFKSFLIII